MFKAVLFGFVAATIVLSIAFASLAVDGNEGENPKHRVIESLEKSGMPGVVSALLISTLPIFELRGGIPIAINYFKIEWWLAYIVCVIGNMIPVVPILLLLGGVSRGLSKFAPFKRFFNWLFERTRRRGGVVDRYKYLGLMLFVAIPLPVTGAWTGSVAAFVFGVRFARSILFIFFGVLIAGVIVTVLSLLGILGAFIAGVALMGLAAWSLLGIKRRGRVEVR